MRSYGITNAAPYAVAPPVGLAGDTYFNTTSKTMFLSDGTQWIQVQGGSSTANYWISRLVANTAISTTIEGTLPIAAANMVAGFTLGAGGANIVCQVAGKYAASLVLMTGTSTASASPFWVGIQHYRGATGIITWDNIGLSAVNGYPYNQVVATGEFDMQVGDTLACVAQAPATTYTVGAQSTFMVWPIGGPKGDPGPQGPDIAAAQSSYFYGVGNSGTSNPASNTQSMICWTTLLNNGFTFVNGGHDITVTRTGKYRVAAQISGYANSNGGSILSTNIKHYDSTATLKVQRTTESVIPQYVGGWCVGACEAILDCVAGDIIQVLFGSANAALIVSVGDTWLEITPIGGVKGDTGPVGPDVTLVQSSYFYGNTSQVLTTDSTSRGLTWQPIFNNGFTLNGVNIVVGQTGKYRVASQVSGNVATTASQWRIITVKHWSSVATGSTVKATRDTVNYGAAASGAGLWATWFGEAILDCAAGDQIQIQVSSENGINVDQSGRNYVEITPVGGTKGDIGPSGGPVPTGGTANQIIVKQSATNMDVAWADNPGALGIIGYKYGAAAGLAITTTVDILHLNALPLKAGRLYELSFKLRALSTLSSNNLRFQAVNLTAGINIQLDDYIVASVPYGYIYDVAIMTVNADGSYGLGVGVSAPGTGGSVWTDGGGFIMVKDIGPNRGQQ